VPRRYARSSVLAAALAAALAIPAAPALASDPLPAPGDVRAVAGDDGIGLAWQPPNGFSAPGYHVYRDGGTDPVATVSTTSYVDPGAPGASHTYTVAAVAADATEGTASAPVGATVPSTVSDPGTLSAVAADGLSDFGSATVTPDTAVPARVTLGDPAGSWSLTAYPANGAAWAPGTVPAVLAGLGCTNAVVDLTVTEARVHADGTPVVLAFDGAQACTGGVTGHVSLRYHAHTGLVAPDTTPEYVTSPVTKPGATSAPTTVTIASRGTGDLVLGTAAVPAGWTLTADGCSGATVAPGASCTLGAVFAPASSGQFSGTLTVPDNTAAGERRVHLFGSAEDVPSPVRDVAAVAYVGRTAITYLPPLTTYPPVEGYFVERATSPAGPWTGGALNPYRSPYVVTGGTPGQHLWFRVVAMNRVGQSTPVVVDVVLPGSELLYTADTGSGVYHLFRQGPAGVPMRVTATATDEEDPALSPDHKTLVYTRAAGSGYHVYKAALDGTNVAGLAGDVNGVPWTYRNPAYSPDGSRVAYACRPVAQSYYDLCVVNLKAGGSRRISAIGTSWSWLPDGTGFVVVGSTGVEIVARDDTYRKTITGTKNARGVALSPDGARIAWTRYDGDEATPGTADPSPRYSLHVAPLSGGAGVTITPTGYSNDPAWSAASDRVFYTHGDRAADGTITRDVYSAPAAGGTPTRLTDTPTVDEDNVTVNDVATPPPAPWVPRPLADFSGDGKAEIAVFRPGTGAWIVQGLPTVTWGRLGDVPVAGDYYGDRRAERAVYRPSDGTWRVYGHVTVKWGSPGDIPVPADYNGDGKLDFAVFRPSTGTWHVYGHAGVAFGKAGDVPLPGNYVGDRRADLAVYRPSTRVWTVANQWSLTQPAGLPAPGDYATAGRTLRAVYDGTQWIVEGYGVVATTNAAVGDLPVVGNFNGDARAEPGAFQPVLGLWRVVGKSNVFWGVPGDIAV
jgi:hypothetical protein